MAAGDSNFDIRAILADLRRSVKRREETKAERLEWFADWWEAIHGELVNANREQWHGGPNFRLGPEDIDHARRMSVWARYMAEDEAWQAHPDNLGALNHWRTVKAAAGNDETAIKAAYGAQPEHIRDRLSRRARSPDKRDVAIERPRNYMPPCWPDVLPGQPWSEYLSALLAAVRVRGCLQPDEEAAQ